MNPAAPTATSVTPRPRPGAAPPARARRTPNGAARFGAGLLGLRRRIQPIGWIAPIAPIGLLVAFRLLVAFGLLALLGCSRESETESTAPPTAPAEARKIASLAPVATNLLLELGRGDRLVAVDAESAKRPGLGHRARVPETDDEAFLLLTSLEADLVVLPTARIELSQRLAAANVRTIVALVRRFEDGFTLYGELAGRVGLAAAARDRIAAASRPLAAIEAESAANEAGTPRPKVAVIASFEPLALVGDDQLATDLVAIAGGENATEGRSEAVIPIERAALAALRPELLFHVRPEAPSPEERAALAASVADVAPLVVAAFDPERFYAPEAAAAARALRDALTRLPR
ncbi:MAG: ABC transporter substrate-binding protein [Myxococcota bacterium]